MRVPTIVDRVDGGVMYARDDGTYVGVREIERDAPNKVHRTGAVRERIELGKFDNRIAAMAAFRRWIANEA